MSGYPNERWSDEHKQLVRRLWARGWTATEISQELAEAGAFYTRNAVIGMVHRNGWRKDLTMKKPAPAPRKPTPTKHRRAQPPAPKPPPSLPAEKPPLPGFRALAFEALRSHHCRWPSHASPFTYCGQTARAGSSYCPDHHKKAHNP